MFIFPPKPFLLLSPINLPKSFAYLYILTTYPFMPFSNSSFEMMPSPSASKSGKYWFSLFVGNKSLKNIDFILVENQSLLNLPFANYFCFSNDVWMFSYDGFVWCFSNDVWMFSYDDIYVQKNLSGENPYDILGQFWTSWTTNLDHFKPPRTT